MNGAHVDEEDVEDNREAITEHSKKMDGKSASTEEIFDIHTAVH